MALQKLRLVLVEAGNTIINPWRNVAAGYLRLSPDLMLGGVGQQQVDSMGSAGAIEGATHDRQNPFGPFWFAVPKKRVSTFRSYRVAGSELNSDSSKYVQNPCCVHTVSTTC